MEFCKDKMFEGKGRVNQSMINCNNKLPVSRRGMTYVYM